MEQLADQRQCGVIRRGEGGLDVVVAQAARRQEELLPGLAQVGATDEDAEEFVARLREMRTYQGLEPLVAQIAQDVIDTRAVLS